MHKLENESGRGASARLGVLMAALAVAALLAIPAFASAHPGVYKVTAKVKPGGTTCNFPDESCLVDQTQYAIANDGWAMGYVEDNGLVSGPGMVNYKTMPGTWRAAMTSQQKLEFAPAQTGVQPHATCSGVAALESPTNVLAWQSADPFYAYIPWQKTSAQLGDEPSKWIPVVQTATGVNLAALSTEAEFKTACEGLPGPGVYHKADTASVIDKATAALKAQEAVAPFEAQVTTLTGEKSALQKEIDAWKAKGGALESEKAILTSSQAALSKQVGSLKKANAKKGKTIKSLRKQLKAARSNG